MRHLRPHRDDSPRGRRRDITELAALADGSLPPERRAAVEARVAASPELRDRLDEQERALELLRGAAAGIDAPAGLRRNVRAQRSARRTPVARRLVFAGAAATIAAVAVVGILALRSSPEQYRAALSSTG